MNDLKALIEQQFIISKLKKEAKLLKRENSQLSLMQCQDKIAQQHGYLHWHELYVLVKRKLNILHNRTNIEFTKNNNILLGHDSLLNKDIYLTRDFHKIHIKQNEYSQSLTFNLFKEILEQQGKFIYCHHNDSGMDEKMVEYAKIKNIPVYHLSFSGNNHSNSLAINFNGMGSGAITEMFIKLVLDDEDHDADMWWGRAISMSSCLFMALVYLRDKGEIKLTPQVIYNYMQLDDFITLYKRQDLPSHTRAALKAYLHSLHKLDEVLYNSDITPKLSEKMLEQHGYLQMQFSKALSIMIHDYSQGFDHQKTSLLDILHKREKFVLIVDFNTPHLQDIRKLFNVFYCIFIQSFVASLYDRELLNYPYYMLLQDIDANLNLPAKFLTSSVNFIVNNKDNADGFTINPTKDGISI